MSLRQPKRIKKSKSGLAATDILLQIIILRRGSFSRATDNMPIPIICAASYNQASVAATEHLLIPISLRQPKRNPKNNSGLAATDILLQIILLRRGDYSGILNIISLST